jgi:anti-anti-sigma factor
MEITRIAGDGALDVGVAGRLDGYWADHLDRALTDVVREGHHHIRLDCSALSFLSSAGIAVLVKFHKELARVNGAFYVVNPSKAVSVSLRITRLADLLREPIRPQVSAAARTQHTRQVEQYGARFDIYELARAAPLVYRTLGSGNPLLAARAFVGEHCFSLESMTPTFVVGVGAFGDSFADCRTRFGELLSVAGATAYQPADGANVPDYLVASGALASDVRMLYCLACEGQFSYLIRFEAIEPGGTIGLSRLAAACLEAAGALSIGIVLVAEAAGLVGGALRRSPAQPSEDDDFFAYPRVRTRLTFTAEPAFARSVALAAGVVARAQSEGPEKNHAQLRPIGADCIGHVHAAAFRFRPIRKGSIDFRETVTGLFEANQLLGVLHLLHDDRGAAGAGESEFVRGALWMGPIASQEL